MEFVRDDFYIHNGWVKIMPIGDEQPPVNIDKDLREYLRRMFEDARAEDLRSSQIPVINVMPGKLSDGKIYYFATAVGSGITQIGFWGRKAGAWVFIA